jgi:hypothetical protein
MSQMNYSLKSQNANFKTFIPNRLTCEQKPNSLPDGEAPDDIVFDILGLTEDERNEIYWAVCELLKNRLEKAKSV